MYIIYLIVFISYGLGKSLIEILHLNYFIIYGTLLAMPWALQFRRHIQINAIIHKLSDLNQRRIGIVMMIILIVFSLYVTIYGSKYSL